MLAKVKCAECGYLAFRHNETRVLMETEPEFREFGVMSARADEERAIPLLGYPICFADAYKLGDEYTPVANGTLAAPSVPHHIELLYAAENRPADYRTRWRIMHRERDCSKWVEYQSGHSPKEHREMLDRAALHHDQVLQNRWNLGIALGGVVVAVIGIAISTVGNYKSAELQAAAQDRNTAAQERIAERKSAPVFSPVINVPAPVVIVPTPMVAP